MKKIFVLIVLFFAVAAYAQNAPQTNPLPRAGSTYQLDQVLNTAGQLIEQGSRFKNNAIAVTLVGSVVGETLVLIGTYQQLDELVIAGGVITLGCGVAALVLDIVGNKKIKEGGRILSNVKFTGTGLSVSF